MPEDLKTVFKEQGLDEDYIKSKLLPGVGFPGYDRPIDYTIHPFPQSLNITTELAVITVYNGDRGRALASFVVKDQKTKEESLPLWDKTTSKGARERYALEAQILRYLGKPRLIESDGRRNRIIMEQWDGSLDEVLFKSFRQLQRLRKQKNYDSSLRDQAKDYAAYAIETLVDTCGQLTHRRRDLEETDLFFEEKGDQDRSEKLMKQLRIIVDRGLEDVADTRKQPLLDSLEHRLQPRGPLHDELRDLGIYLAQGNQIIHHDSRTSNILYKRRSPHTEAHPPPNEVELTLCDYTSVRKGPIGHDIAVLVHDPYFTLFDFTRQERFSLFCKGMVRALPMLQNTEDTWKQLFPGDPRFEEACRHEFNRATIAAVIEKTANPLEIERMNKPRFDEYVEHKKIENNRRNLRVSLNLLDRHLSSFKSFKNLKGIVRELKILRHVNDEATHLS